MSEEARSQSVTLKTYLFLEDIFRAAGDCSPEEAEAKALMDMVFPKLSADEQNWLDSREDPPGIKELEAAALSHGIQEGPQMSRFLLWVGNECFEGREVQSFAVLTARARELVQMFLADESQPVAERGIGLKTSLSIGVTGDVMCGKCGKTFTGSGCPNCNRARA